MVFFSVFAVSLSTLLFEVLINRSFAITQWSHLAFMVIGVALFGLSAGSVWLHVRMSRRGLVQKRQTIDNISLGTGACIAVAWILVQAIPFDSMELPFSRVQILYLAGVFLLLALPFFFAGLVSARGFAAEPGRPGRVYAAAMTGSAAGALLPVLLLPAVGFTGCIIVAAAVPLIPALMGGSLASRAAAASVAAALLALLFLPSLLEPEPSSYKELQQYLQHPDAKITGRKDTINGRVETYRGAGFRSAPGLSLSYTGDIPPQTGVFIDSSSPVALYEGDEPDEFGFALESVGAAAYTAVSDPDRVLVYLESGGSAIPAAIASRAREVTVVDRNKTRASIVEEHYRPFGISVVSGPPRSILDAMHPTYDIVAVDHPGSATPGLLSINEEYILTTGTLTALYEKLSPGGVVTISRRLQIPPSDSLKLFATVYRTLQDAGVERPGMHMCMLRTYNIYTLLFSREPLSPEALSRIRRFAGSRGFDPVFFEGLEPTEANRFSVREEAIYYERIARLHEDLESATGGFSQEYLLNLSVATDDAPYFNRFIKWGRIGDLYRVTGRRSHAFFFTGEILIVAVFAVSLLFSLSIIMVPALLMGMKKTRSQALSSVAFALIGAAFMIFELAWIKRIHPITGDQSSSFAAVIASLLVTSGLGGWISQRLDAKKLPTLAAATAAAIAISAGGMRFLLPEASGSAPPFSWIISLAPVALPGFLMGMLLPLIMRRLCTSEAERIFGWAVNGTLSVLASTVAAGVALFTGLEALLWIAAGLYAAVAIAALLGARRRG